MTESIVETYVATVDTRLAATVRALHQAVVTASPELAVHIAYRMLVYTLGGDRRRWVCAVGTSGKGAHLRFLYGVLLDDHHHVLRPGTSHLMTLDIALGATVDAGLVADYVRQAVAQYEYFRVHEKELGPSTKQTSDVS